MKNYNSFFNKSYDEVDEVSEIESESVDQVEDESIGTFYAKVANCDKVYLRDSADKNSKWLKILDRGTDLIVEDWDYNWYKASTNSGTEGFIMKAFVEIED